MTQDKSQQIAERLFEWMSNQKYGPEDILHAAVVCDTVGRYRFVQAIAEILKTELQGPTDLQSITWQWIDGIENYFKNYEDSQLTQVHARGLFSGISEGDILRFARNLKKNDAAYPLWSQNEA